MKIQEVNGVRRGSMSRSAVIEAMNLAETFLAKAGQEGLASLIEERLQNGMDVTVNDIHDMTKGMTGLK